MLKIERRFSLFLLTCALGLGLALAVVGLAARTPTAQAKEARSPRVAPMDVDLEIDKEGPDPNQTLVNQPVTYTLYITNHLDTPINNVVVTDSWLVKIRGAVLGIPP